MKQISILGCGWLGLPMGQRLIECGFTVKGSTTSDAKIADLRISNIIPYKIEINNDNVIGAIADFLNNSEILLINIPPKFRSSTHADYSAKMKSLIPFIEASTISKVIFVSSTSVYPDNNEEITENTTICPETESGNQLLEAEKVLQENPTFTTTVIRFGGLIGNNRHPVNSLAGRKNIENPKAPINLIHLDDCIGIIEKVIDADYWGDILNGVTPFHPTREVYYHQKAIENNLPLPEFNHQQPSIGKTISSLKTVNSLKYTFKVNPL